LRNYKGDWVVQEPRVSDRIKDDIIDSTGVISKKRRRQLLWGAALLAVLIVGILTTLGYLVFREIHSQNERLQELAIAADEELVVRAAQTRRLLKRFNAQQRQDERHDDRNIRELSRLVRKSVQKVNRLIRDVLQATPEGREILEDLRRQERQGDATPPSQK
jgi:uncharacterized protein HemX